jgi:integrase
MKQSQPNAGFDPFKRHSTRHRGISYRERADGSRAYAIFFEGKYVAAGPTEAGALALQAEYRGKKHRGEKVIVPGKVLVEPVAEEWFAEAARRLRPGTTHEYRRHLDAIIVPRFGRRRIASITAQDIVAFIRELEAKQLAPSTVANVLKPLAGTLNHAVFKGLIAISPMMQVPRGYRPTCNTTREHREWTTEEVNLLVATARRLDARPESRCSYALLIEFLLRTGVRLGEALGARYGDIDFDQGVFNLRRQLTKDGRIAAPKTQKSRRRVPLPPDLVQSLATRSLELGADAEDSLFAPKKGAMPPSQGNFRRRGWAAAVEAAGLTDGPKVTPHDARHAFASQMAEMGITSSDVAEVMGHTTAGITERIYTHAFNREAREERVRQAMAAAMATSQT